MPSVSSGKILVTGASGFIAIWVVKSLLEAGFSVVGTVRSENKGEYLKKTFEKYGGKFEYVIVEDIEKVKRHPNHKISVSVGWLMAE
jgi:nucleoside-diphosphate-sugar epimerase